MTDRLIWGPVPLWPLFVKIKKPGNDLLSHPAAQAVPSARTGLTSVFGMGTGVAPPLKSPGFNAMLEPSGTKSGTRTDFRRNSNMSPFFCLDKLYGQASRSISTGQLNASLRLHLQPINLVVYQGPLALAGGRSNLGACFPLICFQRLSQPNVATQRCPWRDNWYTRGSSTQVLSYYGQPPSNLLRLPWIGTELSHDVLNPARVPL